MSSGRSRPVAKRHFSVTCQTDAVHKQPVSRFSLHSPLSKTALGEAYILMIDRHLGAKKKTFLACLGSL